MTLAPLDPPAGESIRILIADDHALVRTGLRMILEDEPGFEVVGEAANGARALELAFALMPTILLADISMPPPDGIELARLLCQDDCPVKTIMVSMHEDAGLLREALAVGVWGYVAKRSGPAEMIRAIRAVAAGEIYIDRNLG